MASCEVSRKSLDTSRIAVQSLGRVWIPAGLLRNREISRKSMETSRIAVKSQGRVWTPAG